MKKIILSLLALCTTAAHADYPAYFLPEGHPSIIKPYHFNYAFRQDNNNHELYDEAVIDKAQDLFCLFKKQPLSNLNTETTETPAQEIPKDSRIAIRCCFPKPKNTATSTYWASKHISEIFENAKSKVISLIDNSSALYLKYFFINSDIDKMTLVETLDQIDGQLLVKDGNHSINATLAKKTGDFITIVQVGSSRAILIRNDNIIHTTKDNLEMIPAFNICPDTDRYQRSALKLKNSGYQWRIQKDDILLLLTQATCWDKGLNDNFLLQDFLDNDCEINKEAEHIQDFYARGNHEKLITCTELITKKTKSLGAQDNITVFAVQF